MDQQTMYYGISDAAHRVPCAESTLRGLERRGIIKPIRDSARRRLFSDADIQAAQQHLGRSQSEAVA